jgi:DNA-binding transcriptional LysR family regulator
MVPTTAGQALARRIAAGFAHLRSADTRLQSRRAGSSRLARLATGVQLRALSAVIETGGFSSAARKLHLSQPSVHRALRGLEELARVPLWHRKGQAIDPTSEARSLCADIDLCLSEFRLGIDEARESVRGPGGTLLIGALPSARVAWLPRSLAATVTQYPEARASIMDGPYEEQLRALRHGRIDLIVGALRVPIPAPDIRQQEIYKDAISIVVRRSHPLAARAKSEARPLTREQLLTLSWILPPVDSPVRHSFEALMRKHALPSTYRALECTSMLVIQSLLVQTDFAAVITTSQMESESVRSQLCTLGPPLQGSTHPVGITLRTPFTPTHLQRAFINTLRTAAPESQSVD